MAAALALRGAEAQLNFPSMASTLPRPADLTDKSIQAAAIEAAHTFSRHRRWHISQSRRLSTSGSDHVVQSSILPPPETSSCEDRVSNYSSESVDFITSSDTEMESMYSVPADSSAVDSDEGPMLSAWEPRLWSF